MHAQADEMIEQATTSSSGTLSYVALTEALPHHVPPLILRLLHHSSTQGSTRRTERVNVGRGKTKPGDLG
jgi:hypothetical protein